MRCIRCNKDMRLDFGIDTPIDGISLVATGNYGSSKWDPFQDGLRFTTILCDSCFAEVSHDSKYIVYESISTKHYRRELTAAEALREYEPKVRKINEFVPPSGRASPEEVFEEMGDVPGVEPPDEVWTITGIEIFPKKMTAHDPISGEVDDGPVGC